MKDQENNEDNNENSNSSDNKLPFNQSNVPSNLPLYS